MCLKRPSSRSLRTGFQRPSWYVVSCEPAEPRGTADWRVLLIRAFSLLNGFLGCDKNHHVSAMPMGVSEVKSTHFPLMKTSGLSTPWQSRSRAIRGHENKRNPAMVEIPDGGDDELIKPRLRASS